MIEYTFEGIEAPLDPYALLLEIACYRYQSCEHPQWTDSASADHCSRLREAAMHGLTVADVENGKAYPAGYDEAPWGIYRLADALSGIRTAGSVQ